MDSLPVFYRRLLLVIPLQLFFSNILVAQHYPDYGILIYKDTAQVQANPFIAQIDSAEWRYYEGKKEMGKECARYSYDAYEGAILYALNEQGDSVSIIEYLSGIKRKNRADMTCHFEVLITWNGRINRVRLIGFEGEPSDFRKYNFREIWKNIQSTPPTKLGYPSDQIIKYPIILKGRKETYNTCIR